MAFVRKWVIIALVGALVGDIATMATAPAIIAWYNSTTDPSALCNCLTTARSTAARMIEAQGISSAIGAFLFVIVGSIVSRSRRKRLREQVAAAPPAAPKPSSTQPG